ncbi:hypothetical protein CEJ88_04780, partial [Staphylococcus aureus]
RASVVWIVSVFFVQAEDGIRKQGRYRGHGDLYKCQLNEYTFIFSHLIQFTKLNPVNLFN